MAKEKKLTEEQKRNQAITNTILNWKKQNNNLASRHLELLLQDYIKNEIAITELMVDINTFQGLLLKIKGQYDASNYLTKKQKELIKKLKPLQEESLNYKN